MSSGSAKRFFKSSRASRNSALVAEQEVLPAPLPPDLTSVIQTLLVEVSYRRRSKPFRILFSSILKNGETTSKSGKSFRMMT
ncbi:hypothetical protein D3C87_1793760 [compost metagenome]